MRAYLDFRHSDEEADHFNKIGFGAKITNAYQLENGFIIVVVDKMRPCNICSDEVYSAGAGTGA